MGGLWSKQAYGADTKEAGRSPLNEAESPEFCSAALLKMEVLFIGILKMEKYLTPILHIHKQKMEAQYMLIKILF